MKIFCSQTIRFLHGALKPMAAGLAMTALLATPLARAEPPSQPQMTAEQSQKLQQFKQLQQDMQQLQQQLDEIQKATLEAKPELAQQQKDVEKMVMEQLRASGNDPEQKVKEIKSLQTKIKNEDLPVDQRKSYYQEYRQKVADFQKAQHEVMQDEKVQSAMKDLNKAMLVAMKEQNPKTDQLISDIKKKQEAMMEIRRSVMSNSK